MFAYRSVQSVTRSCSSALALSQLNKWPHCGSVTSSAPLLRLAEDKTVRGHGGEEPGTADSHPSDTVLRVSSFRVVQRWAEIPSALPFQAQPQPARSAALRSDTSHTDAPLCKHYVNTGSCARGEACYARHVRDKDTLDAWVRSRRAQRAEAAAAARSMLAASVNEPEPESFGDAAAKSNRAELFAAWLVQTFGTTTLRRGAGVLDVAGGGAGGLSFYLCTLHGVPCTVVDPRPPHLSKRQRSLLAAAAAVAAAAGSPAPLTPRHAAQLWEADSWAELLQGASAVVGMHPDGAADGIVAAALQAGLPFALVPCCVFPGVFVARRLPDGRRVRSREDLIVFLHAQAGPGARLAHLPFQGAATVLWRPALPAGDLR
jgi:hypothetical protein